ncbi:malto-oligosyltrehalose trehalohydrolase [Chryseolinea sp. T2]|uniref:malto-oligosyltrehalose trehalohydrolase n=1 Tax=Chryseolinea sp. T2 TaxID=3129255 RepID=UPI0030782874
MSVIVPNRRSIGVNFSSRGESEVLVWAPHAKSVAIVIDGTDERVTLHPEPRGYFSSITSLLKPDDAYWVELDQRERLPDPASLLQPRGIFGPSLVFNPNTFKWTDQKWKNIPLSEYIIYELHVGTFTQAGDFDAIVAKLPYLKELGITSIEIMPAVEFPGNRNWGYDGVFPYAIHHSYGGPSALQRLVDASHSHGIAVILDVVYNHFGPEGNNLEKFGPYFTDKYRTPWGKAINYDDAGCDEVRKFFVENALMWFRDFHIDALRLDAVHAIYDFSSKHILQELREYVDTLREEVNRNCYLIAECDLNDPKYLEDASQMSYGMNAQWIDEFHHSLRVAAGKKPVGYYSDFKEFVTLGKAFADAYVYDGQYSEHRKKTFGRKATAFRGDQFVVFSQNHDQVGNTMLGERTSVIESYEMLKVMAAMVICSPYIPMLFMGEEYGERQPFQYFISHHDETLISAVRQGRKSEFAAFYQHDVNVPDPQSIQTFLNSKLNWDYVNVKSHQTLLEYYKELIRTRKVSEVLSSGSREGLSAVALEDEKCLIVHRKIGGNELVSVANFSSVIQNIQMPSVEGMKCIMNSASARWSGQMTNDPLYAHVVSVSPATFFLFSNENV